MKYQYYSLSSEERSSHESAAKAFLAAKDGILFAYIHGSFVTGERFRDVDVAVYFANHPVHRIEEELSLESELSRVMKHLPVDLRILNDAPLSFRYNVIRYGRPVFVRDSDARFEFVEATLRDYFDFAPYRKMYLRETLGLGL
jgi:hypothetical protein